MKSPPTTLYGIASCDTVRKARAWLDSHAVPFQFHDFKKVGVPIAALHDWLHAIGQEELINRRGTTWRGLDASTRHSVSTNAEAHAFLLQHFSAIRRPVVDWGEGSTPRFTAGFDESVWTLLISPMQKV